MSGERDATKLIGYAIALIGGGASAIAYVVALKSTADHNTAAIVEVREEQRSHAERLQAIEANHEMINRVHAIETNIAAMTAQLHEIDRLLRRRERRTGRE